MMENMYGVFFFFFLTIIETMRIFFRLQKKLWRYRSNVIQCVWVCKCVYLCNFLKNVFCLCRFFFKLLLWSLCLFIIILLVVSWGKTLKKGEAHSFHFVNSIFNYTYNVFSFNYIIHITHNIFILCFLFIIYENHRFSI